MRRKVGSPEMADSTASAALSRLLSAMEHVDVRGRGAAFSLYTINHLSATQEPALASIVKHLFCVVGLVPALRDLLEAVPDVPLFTPHQIQALYDHVDSCHVALKAVDAAVREADRRASTEAPASFHPQGGVQHVLNTVTACFHHMAIAVTAAKAERLSRSAALTDDIFENRRLSLALKHPEYIKQIATASPSMKDALELQHPRGFRGRYGHPDYPLLHKQQHVHLSPSDPGLRFNTSFEEDELRRQQLRSEGRYPDRASFGVWPPTFIAPNSIQERQLLPLFGPRTMDQPPSLPPPPPPFAASSAVNTPASTRESTPAAEGEKDVATTTPGVSPTETVVDKEKPPCQDTAAAATTTTTTTNTHAPEVSTGNTQAKPSITSADKPSEESKDKSDPPSKLEAHMLRPMWEETRDGIEWSFKIEQLPIDDEQVQAHMQTLGPNYSIVTSISELLPLQVRLIRNYVRGRHGHLQSVQYGQAANLVTKMGTFQIKSVVFTLKASKAEIEKPTVHNSTISQCSIFGKPGQVGRPFGSATNNIGGGLFGNTSNNNSTGLFGNTNNNNNGGLFGNTNNNNSGGLFGNPNNNNRGLFGPTSSNGGGLFGNPSNNIQNNNGGGLFGPANNSGGFGAHTNNNGSGLFGNNSAYTNSNPFSNSHNNTTSGCLCVIRNQTKQFSPFANPTPQHGSPYHPSSQLRSARIGDLDPFTAAIINSSTPPLGQIPEAFYVEREPTYSNTSHYQSIVSNPTYRGLSVEELRLADIQAGRTGPPTTSSSTFGGGVFGAKPPVYQTIANNPPTFGNSPPAASGGWFPGFGAPTQPGGLFSGIGSGSDKNSASPFGVVQNNTAPSSGGLFNAVGAQSTAPLPNTAPTLYGATPSSSGPFGGVGQARSTGGLFGVPGQTPFGGSLFANTRPQTTTSGLFGIHAAQATAPPFGQRPAATGLFEHIGTQQGPKVPTVTPLFGAAATPSAAAQSTAIPPKPAPAPNSLFGVPGAAPAQSGRPATTNPFDQVWHPPASYSAFSLGSSNTQLSGAGNPGPGSHPPSSGIAIHSTSAQPTNTRMTTVLTSEGGISLQDASYVPLPDEDATL